MSNLPTFIALEHLANASARLRHIPMSASRGPNRATSLNKMMQSPYAIQPIMTYGNLKPYSDRGLSIRSRITQQAWHSWHLWAAVNTLGKSGSHRTPPYLAEAPFYGFRMLAILVGRLWLLFLFLFLGYVCFYSAFLAAE